jgi:transcriptional regulator with XRE-family HTH domain
MIHLGNTARELRCLLGFTQREAARRLGISVVHLCNIENQKASPSPDLLDRFRQLWDIDLYVFAWCQHGDTDKLPPALRKSCRALAAAWKKQVLDVVQKKKRKSSSCSTFDK